MKESFRKFALGAGLAVCAASSSGQITAADVISAMEKSAQWHIQNPYPDLPVRTWEMAAYYDGLINLSRVSGDARYWADVIRLGQSAGWTPGNRVYHADDHAVGHAWLDTYAADPSKKSRLEPFVKRFEDIIANVSAPEFANKFGPSSPNKTWNWCDALFMAPPTLVRLYMISGDKKYLDYMDAEYKHCYDSLWSPQDNLFYRDKSYIGKTTKSGKKIFWGRGNGWVIGGLVQILSVLPKNNPSYAFYRDLYIKMAQRLAEEQLEDGLWGVSLADKDHFAGGETSSSGFFTYALAWGVNSGLLDRAKYEPAVLKAWQGLLTRVHENGMVGYVQPVGASPDKFSKETTQAYGIGVFLLAGSEVAKTLGAKQSVSDAELVKKADAIFNADTKRAYAHIEPRRLYDIAWENDKMAFRVYGPPLKDKIENSGIDVWLKSVDYPIIDKWYDDDLAGVKSYHKDSGEGLDCFKVGDSVGLGGTGIWKDGKLYKSDVYVSGDVIWSRPQESFISMQYVYDAEGAKFAEKKNITLEYGADVCRVRSVFIDKAATSSFLGFNRFAKTNAAKGLDVAVGLLPQDKNFEVKTDGNFIKAFGELGGKPFYMFVEVAEGVKTEGFQTLPSGEVVAILKTDENGAIEYVFGYVWGAKARAAFELKKKADKPAKPLIIPATLNVKDDGFRGIWYGIPYPKSVYKYKYGGGLATYPANHYPIAQYSKEAGKTFFVYGGTDKAGKTLLHEIAYFDHATGKISKPTIILDKGTSDAHDNPVMIIGDGGYIYVFSPTHGEGRRASAIHKSVKPYDISAFENVNATYIVHGEKKPLYNFSYPQIWRLKDGSFLMLCTLYGKNLGYLPKGAKTIRAIYSMTSPDGVNWSEPSLYGCVGEGHYQSSGGYKGEKVGTSFNYHPSGKKEGGLNHRTNLYFMETSDGGKTWLNALGQKVETPLTDPENLALVRDYEAEGKKVYISDLVYDAEGRPAILYLVSDGFMPGPENGAREWFLARFDGKTWRYSKVCESMNNYDFGSIYFAGGGKVRVIASGGKAPQPYNTGGEICLFESEDGGKTWAAKSPLTHDSAQNQTYPRRPLNVDDGFYAFWADGNGLEKSPSSLYFCNAEGEVFKMPETMKDDLETPQAVK